MTTSTSTAIKEDLNRSSESDNYEPEIHFEPVISLPLVDRVITFEEDEDLLIKLRAKLYRFDSTETPSIWKERGTGDVKLLHHTEKHTVRIVMRRDKTLKICANHFITPSMKLQRPNNNRNNWWIWSVSSDFADEVAKAEIFAIKFASEENADLWKKKFTEGQSLIQQETKSTETNQTDNLDKSENSGDASESEADDLFEDALDKSNITSATEGLSESILGLDISK